MHFLCIAKLTCESGRCYQIGSGDGRLWGYQSDQDCYSVGAVAEESAIFKTGKFQFCMDHSCTEGTEINPVDGFSMKDMHGIPPAGNKPNSWLNNVKGDNHIGKTWDYAQAGRFSITKWSYGSYCIGGASPKRIGAIRPNTTIDITFAAGDSQACIEVTLKEVPCDIRATTNNCIWKNLNGPSCGGPDDYSIPTSQPAVGVAPAAQRPVKPK